MVEPAQEEFDLAVRSVVIQRGESVQQQQHRAVYRETDDLPHVAAEGAQYHQHDPAGQRKQRADQMRVSIESFSLDHSRTSGSID